VTYAKGTTVAPEKSRLEIERVLMKYGARDFGYMMRDGMATVVFAKNDRRIRFNLPTPKTDERGGEQRLRERWRALLLCIKAKLESVESKIETFDEAFLAHVVMPGGQTVYEASKDQIAIAYQNGKMDGPLMLEGPR
jgi:hypothetical protein